MQDNLPKKIFVCEFITSGGLCDVDLPPSLAKEGALMRDCLLQDLANLKQYTVIGMHDARLAKAALQANSHAVAGSHKDFIKLFKKLLKQADYVWLIAPETDGALLELCEICYENENKQDGALMIGSGFNTILTGTSKSLSCELLQANHIHTLPVYGGEDLMQEATFNAILQANYHVQQWLAKPEDGAGCEGIRLFDSLAALRDWLKLDDQYLHYFAQAYQAGTPASFSMLCARGKAHLLCANLQHIAQYGNTFKLTGITINGATQYWAHFETIARKLAKALPDALGYVGVDVIISADNIFVVDINPRLTSSYAGLRTAMAYNPAQLILDFILDANFKMPTLAKNQVQIKL